MNWKQLKDFCNSLSESELEKNVMLWREDEAITDINAEQLEEDYVVLIEEQEDGCFGVSTAESLIKEAPSEYPEKMEHFKKVYDKGFPILHEVF